MPQSTLLLILLAAALAIGLAGLLYFYRNRNSHRYLWALFSLRAASIFCLLLLLINPKLEANEYFVEKPELILAVDNSASIENLDQTAAVREFVSSLLEDEDIQDRFETTTYGFGSSISPADSFSFAEPQTNIQSALENIRAVHKNKNSATVLISDGNQTFGSDYRYVSRNAGRTIFPVAVGDTTAQKDLSISRVNVNKYAFLGNEFPVEIFVSYAGGESVIPELRISRAGTTVFSDKISLNTSNTSAVIHTTLPASSIGRQLYKVEITALAEEKNTANNLRNFSIEVIDERSKVLLVSNLSHPDLGALKNSIASNQQREVQLAKTAALPEDLEEYSLVILYQPTADFAQVMERLMTTQRNFWIITGPETDWRFLNRQQPLFHKEVRPQTEEFFPIVNEGFSSFQFEDFGFAELPPLVDSFGELTAAEGVEILLFQEVQGFPTNRALLATVEEAATRKAFLFGANLWRWRSESFVNQGSFEAFDKFIGGLVQYLSSQRRQERLSISYEPFYYGNDQILLTAQYFDKNYSFDPRGNLSLSLSNTQTGETRELPLSLAGNRFQVNLSGLAPGDYDFSIRTEGENLSRSGSFNVADYAVEDQFTRANVLGLQHLADQSGGQLYFPDQAEELREVLLRDNNYVAVQKSRQKRVSLVDWYYLLGLLALFLAAEWFLRKYHGLI